MRTFINKPTIKLFEYQITCNKCGLVYDLEKDDLEEWQADFIHKFTTDFGYASSHDGEVWHFDLCEKCLEELAKDFKVPVEVHNWF
jgi:hypothetical protein